MIVSVARVFTRGWVSCVVAGLLAAGCTQTTNGQTSFARPKQPVERQAVGSGTGYQASAQFDAPVVDPNLWQGSPIGSGTYHASSTPPRAGGNQSIGAEDTSGGATSHYVIVGDLTGTPQTFFAIVSDVAFHLGANAVDNTHVYAGIFDATTGEPVALANQGVVTLTAAGGLGGRLTGTFSGSLDDVTGCQSAADCRAGEQCISGQCVGAPACTSSAQCGANQQCVSGVCVTIAGCTSSAQCAAGEQCVSSACVAIPACTSNAQCAAGEQCVAGVCVVVPACTSNAQCAAGETCQRGTCIPTVPACTSSAQCGAGEQCISGVCVAVSGCTSNAQCNFGEACVAGQCVPTGCTSNAQCGTGQTCQAGRCVGGSTQCDGKQGSGSYAGSTGSTATCSALGAGTVSSSTALAAIADDQQGGGLQLLVLDSSGATVGAIISLTSCPATPGTVTGLTASFWQQVNASGVTLYAEHHATSAAITYTQVSATIAGTFTLQLPGGGSVTGSFTVQ